MVELQLAPTAEAPALARRAVMAMDCDEPSMHRLTLLVSELVTNSVRHARLGPDAEISFSAEVRADKAHVRVCDPGDGPFLATRPRHEDDPGGLGLFLVDQLADRWGIERNSETCVWFEVPRRESQART